MLKKVSFIMTIAGAIYVLLIPVLLKIIFSGYFNGISLFTLAIPGNVLLSISCFIQIFKKNKPC